MDIIELAATLADMEANNEQYRVELGWEYETNAVWLAGMAECMALVEAGKMDIEHVVEQLPSYHYYVPEEIDGLVSEETGEVTPDTPADTPIYDTLQPLDPVALREVVHVGISDMAHLEV